MLEIFITFFKLGLFTFGGGYAMIPLIKETIINKKKWMTEDEVIEMIAIAESTPGPIAINMATYIGHKQKGLLGSIIATLGVILPSMIVIYLISLCFDTFLSNKYIQYAFIGIKCGVAILILKTGIEMLLKSKRSIINIITLSVVTVLMVVLDILSINLSAIVLILLGGLLVGVLGGIIREKLDSDDIDKIVSSVYNSKKSSHTTRNEDTKDSSTNTINIEQTNVDTTHNKKDTTKNTTFDNDMIDIDTSNDTTLIDNDSTESNITLDDMIYNLEQEMAQKEQEKIKKETENLEHIDTINTTKSSHKKIDTNKKSIKVEKEDISNLENMFGSANNIHSKKSTDSCTNNLSKNAKDRRVK